MLQTLFGESEVEILFGMHNFMDLAENGGNRVKSSA